MPPVRVMLVPAEKFAVGSGVQPERTQESSGVPYDGAVELALTA
jgi:hypothetical protein